MSELRKATKAELDAIFAECCAEFPAEAYQKDTSRGFELTSMKAQYAIERMNTVFGMGKWGIPGTYQDLGDKGVLFIGQLVIDLSARGFTDAFIVDAVGFSSNTKNVGDAYKGARTDALSKAASYVGIGNEMFKGNINSKGASKNDNVTPIKSGSKATRSFRRPKKKAEETVAKEASNENFNLGI